MAIGIFDDLLISESWFDNQVNAEGWFDESLLKTVAILPEIAISKGGHKPKKHARKNESQSITETVSNAIEEITGEVIQSPKKAEIPQENNTYENDGYIRQVENQRRLLQQESMRLSMGIEQLLIELENDEEEALLMLIG